MHKRQGHRHQAGILAGEEHGDEVGRRLGHDRHPIAALGATAGEPPGEVDGAATQLAVGQGGLELAAGREEVEARDTLRSIVETGDKRSEVRRP